jgi:mannitol-1-phosphate/altronate dehydrogenase
VTEIPQGYQGKDYIAEVIQRFQNSALPYFAQQVNSDSSQKIILRWFPSIDNALLKNTDTAFMSFIVAAWVVYVERALDANELNDPLDHHLMKANQKNVQTVEQFLTIIGASHFNFTASARFMTDVTNAYQTLTDINISNALSDFLTKNTSQPKELDHA